MMHLKEKSIHCKNHKILNCVLPRTINAVLENRIYIEKGGLPSALLNHFKRLTAFQNPEFYKRQSMRLSTALTPRIISCIEETETYIAIPRGCLEDITNLCETNRISFNFDDKRSTGKTIDVSFQGELSQEQQKACKKLIEHDMGILVAPPGVGKTIIAIGLIVSRKVNTLVLVHRRPLLEQWRAQLASFLGIAPKEIGQIGGGKDNPTHFVDVGMIQSLDKHGGMKAPLRKEMLAMLSELPDTEERLILATGQYIGEGFDDPRLDTLFLAMPFSFKGKMIQYTGRLHRQYEGESEIRIYDYVDRNIDILSKMYERRLKTYKLLEYVERTAHV